VRVHHADVLTWLRRRSGPDARSGRRAAKPKGPDTVVLDPPRKGAGAAVVDLLDRTSAGRCVYIACDPASLGRDTGLLSRAGWRLESVRGLDIFPMTHHVETVAVFAR
jgi:tRNA/tmRNA/rRNA uracil-C5-methylase (TrmA/RlmC/RlmD family)